MHVIVRIQRKDRKTEADWTAEADRQLLQKLAAFGSQPIQWNVLAQEFQKTATECRSRAAVLFKKQLDAIETETTDTGKEVARQAKTDNEKEVLQHPTGIKGINGSRQITERQSSPGIIRGLSDILSSTIFDRNSGTMSSSRILLFTFSQISNGAILYSYLVLEKQPYNSQFEYKNVFFERIIFGTKYICE